jgi:3',5'-cyclic AMP phosphodiesterase CpdA
MPTYREGDELDGSITYLYGPNLSLRCLDHVEQAVRATLAIHPPSEDWSDMRYWEPEGSVIDRLTVEATETLEGCTDYQVKAVEDGHKHSETQIDCMSGSYRTSKL